ncbi:MAG: BrnT family toxin [Sulfuricella sp.]|nr:BrnT family toxin [Sulfuricella sp.]
MKVTFDQTKDVANIAKHGVSLADAARLEWDELLAKPDNRADYGEVRMIGFAPVHDRLFCVVFTDRDGERRIISLRKANDREVRNYANQD